MEGLRSAAGEISPFTGFLEDDVGRSKLRSNVIEDLIDVGHASSFLAVTAETRLALASVASVRTRNYIGVTTKHIQDTPSLRQRGPSYPQ